LSPEHQRAAFRLTPIRSDERKTAFFGSLLPAIYGASQDEGRHARPRRRGSSLGSHAVAHYLSARGNVFVSTERHLEKFRLIDFSNRIRSQPDQPQAEAETALQKRFG
jgi:hypothetical protein